MDQERTTALQRLCDLHPRDARAHVRLGEHLMAQGREIAAVLAFRKAWRLLKDERPVEAEKLARQYGEEVTADELKPLASGDYLSLARFHRGLKFRYRQVRLAEGDILFRRGDAADAVYLVLEGELAVLARTGEGSAPVLLNYLHRGALVGEGALSEGVLRSADVVANKACRLLRFSPAEFESAVAGYPELRLRFAKEGMLRRRMALLSSHDLFARLPMDLRFLVARRAWLAGFEKGATIRPAGSFFPHAALIANGAARLYEDRTPNARLDCGRVPSGMMIGLPRLMHAEVAALTMVADESCELVCMDRKVVEDLMQASPWFRQQLTRLTRYFADHVVETILLQRRLAGAQ